MVNIIESKDLESPSRQTSGHVYNGVPTLGSLNGKTHPKCGRHVPQMELQTEYKGKSWLGTSIRVFLPPECGCNVASSRCHDLPHRAVS